ncbi:MAG: hypothetical protein ACI9VR_002967 [Cognaticolwellia sp.]|jgi:hypothetical protein
MLAAPSQWILPQGPVAVLLDQAKIHRVMGHPYLSALVTRQLPNPGHALRDGLLQLLPWIAAQKTAWQDLAGRVDHPAIVRGCAHAEGRWDGATKALLFENELGYLKPRSSLSLYVGTLKALGFQAEWKDRSKFCKQSWRHLRRFQRTVESGDPLHAAGGLILGTELVFGEIAVQLLAALAVEGSPPSALAPLRARILLAQSHEPELLSVLQVMAAQPRGLSRIAGGRTLALDNFATLLDGLMERAWRGDQT